MPQTAAQVIEHCSECVDLLGDYLDGALPPERQEALEAHLAKCPPCITFVRTYKATSRLCREKMKMNQEMPPELVSSLHQFLGQKIPGFAACADSGCTPKKPGSEGKH